MTLFNIGYIYILAFDLHNGAAWQDEKSMDWNHKEAVSLSLILTSSE